MSTDSPEILAASPTHPARENRLRPHLRHAVFAVPVAVYVVLVLLGITTSSVGIDFLRENPGDPNGLQIGQSQLSRSDEFGTESPLWLGQMERGGVEDSTPLSVSNDYFAQLPAGPFSAVVFADGSLLALGEWVPHEMLFAAKWWLPSLLLFIGLPILFRQFTGSLRWGYLAAVLVFVAPATMWWSGRPVNTLGFVAAGCALAVYAFRRFVDRDWIRAGIAVTGSGILLARLPSYYQPLAIVIGVPIVIATALFIATQRVSRRDRAVSLGAIVVSGALWTGTSIWENRDAFAAGLSTVYPGDRASTGEAVNLGMVFGAPGLGWLEQLSQAVPVSQPELVTAFTVLLLVVAVLAAARRWTGGVPLAAVVIALAVMAAFWLSWATIDWGAPGAAIPLVNRVPNTRAAQGVGYLAIIVFCLYMSQWRTPRRPAAALVAGGLAGFLTAYAASLLQDTTLPNLTVAMIWLSAAATGAVVFALTRWPRKIWPLVTAGVAATALTFTAPPIIFGLGDLRASTTAGEFESWGAEARADGSVWASDSQFVDALMMATGTPALSARQQIGPDIEEWSRLDPTREHEAMWNRGGLHITFDWTQSEQLTFTQPVADVIVVSGSPCAVAERIPELRHVASDTTLDAECLTPVGEFRWTGIDHTAYEIAVTN